MGRFSTKFHFSWNLNFPMNLGFLRFSIYNLQFLWVSIVHPFYVVFIHNLVYSKFPQSLWKVMHLLCVISEKWIFRKKYWVFWRFSYLNHHILEVWMLHLFYVLFIHNFNIIKNFQERMQSDALMLHLVWKMGFFKQFIDFWDYSYLIL